MATTHIAPMLENRIRELNRKIDSKILRGRSYRKEAREHRALLSQLKYVGTSRRHAGHPLSFFSFF